MADKNRHIIHKILAELTVPNQDRLRERSDHVRQAVQYAVEKLDPVLNKLPEDQFFEIDTLLVELNVRSSEFNHLQEKIEKVLFEEISGILSKNRQDGKNEEISPGSRNDVQLRDRYEDLIFHFLETGRLPWWAGSEIVLEAEEWLLELPEETRIEWLLPLLQKRPRLVRRFIRQFPASITEEFVHHAARKKSGSDDWVGLLTGILQVVKERENINEIIYNHLKHELYEIVLMGVLLEHDSHKLMEELLLSVIHNISPIMNGKHRKERIFESLKTWLEKSTHPASQQWVKEIEMIRDSLPAGSQNIGDQSVEIDLTEEKISETAKEFVIFNVGMVLLHPFLEKLFKNLALLENGKFVNPAACERAVCLLHNMATGRSEFPDYELLLPKFLCGWPFSEPVDRFLTLSKYEITECEKVLKSVIYHWEILKNTSIDGLRENFLKRDGILKKEEFGCALYVEQKTHDILLEQLPWEISIVKLKWMEEMLTVQWQ